LAAFHVAALNCEHVEDHEHDSMRLRPWSMRSQSRGKLGSPSLPRRDELAVDRQAVRQRGELGDETGHVPAAAALDAQLAVPGDERAEPVPRRYVDSPEQRLR
jgi:hypothetical protein